MKKITSGMRDACAAVLKMEQEGVLRPYSAQKIREAEESLGKCYTSETEKKAFVESLKKNIIDQYKYPFFKLDLHISQNTFIKEKNLFYEELLNRFVY